MSEAITHRHPLITQEKKPGIIDVKVNNWSGIRLPLVEVAVYGNGRKGTHILGRTDMVAGEVFETHKGEQTTSTFRTMARFKDTFTLEIVASKTEDGAIQGKYTDLALWALEGQGATEEEIQAKKEEIEAYQKEHRQRILSQSDVHVGRIDGIDEPVKVTIDILDEDRMIASVV